MSEYIVEMPKEPAKVVRDGWNVRIEWQYKQREEIVRCRDCKHYDEHDAGCSYFVLAKNKLLHIGNPDGFCSWAERQEIK